MNTNVRIFNSNENPDDIDYFEVGHEGVTEIYEDIEGYPCVVVLINGAKRTFNGFRFIIWEPVEEQPQVPITDTKRKRVYREFYMWLQILGFMVALFLIGKYVFHESPPYWAVFLLCECLYMSFQLRRLPV
jgi:hypothetical protein